MPNWQIKLKQEVISSNYDILWSIFVMENLDNSQIIEKQFIKVHEIVDFTCGTFKQKFSRILIGEKR